jgi:CBS domain-containing protein/uncharacterized protein (DUF2267 family)
MSLDRFRRPRMIVLHPETSAYEAARAMAEHEIGCVLVGEGHHIVGMVTDRDLTLEVLAAGLDPQETRLGEVMSREVVTLDVSADLAEVTRLMRLHACRRIPILEDGRPVGMVTLDDLLIDGEFAQATRLVVAAQLDEASRRAHARARRRERASTLPPAPAPGSEEEAEGEGEKDARRSLLRHRGRAESTHARLLKAIERDAGLHDSDRAGQALRVVLGSICRRLTATEARHFIAQLPSKLQPFLATCTDGPARDITAATIVATLGKDLGLEEEAATEAIYAICEAVSDSISPGALDSLRSHLPATMRDLFPPTPFARSA